MYQAAIPKILGAELKLPNLSTSSHALPPILSIPPVVRIIAEKKLKPIHTEIAKVQNIVTGQYSFRILDWKRLISAKANKNRLLKRKGHNIPEKLTNWVT